MTHDAHRSPRRPARRSAARGLAAATATAAALALGGVAASASYANSDYEGAYASTAPSGYSPAPAETAPQSTVSYTFTVTTSDLLPPPLTGSIWVQRVTVVDGRNVAGGSPALTEDQVLAGRVTGDDPQQVGQLDGTAVIPAVGAQVQVTFTVPDCGYYVVWAGQSTDRSDPSTVLNAGAVRVDGCASTTASPSAPPRHHTTPSRVAVAAASTPAPTATPAVSTSDPPEVSTHLSGPRRGSRGTSVFDASAFPPAASLQDSGLADGLVPARPIGGVAAVVGIVVLGGGAAAVGAAAWLTRRRRRPIFGTRR